MHEIQDLYGGLGAVSLDEMNERASLQRRTDNKYLDEIERLASLVEQLADDHEVLEIDGERVFEYESTYFDTGSLRCFREHVDDRRPRFKARTRCYVMTGDCFFEVKVKQADGETTKRNLDYDPDERSTVVPRARQLLEDVLEDCGIDAPDDLRRSLVTTFCRVTVVARDRPERTTFDFCVSLNAPEGDRAQLDKRYVIAETKTAEGDGAWDRALGDGGCDPISLSKYRIGAGLLRAPDDDGDYAPELKRLFELVAPSR
jgi:hypothetical protein